MEVTNSHERGIRYLTAAKKTVAIGRFLDEDDAAMMRRAADRLTEVGLGLIVKGAREMAALLKERTTSGSANDQG